MRGARLKKRREEKRKGTESAKEKKGYDDWANPRYPGPQGSTWRIGHGKMDDDIKDSIVMKQMYYYSRGLIFFFFYYSILWKSWRGRGAVMSIRERGVMELKGT